MRHVTYFAVLLCVSLLPACGGPSGHGDFESALSNAWKAYSTGDFDYAERVFARVERSESATASDRFSAVLGLASIYHLHTSPNLPRAEIYYTRLSEMPLPEARPIGLLGLGRVALQKGDVERGRALLEQLRQEFPDSVYADEATISLASSYWTPREQRDAPGGYVLAPEPEARKGMQVLEQQLTARPQNSLAALMHMMLADKLVERRQFAQAVSHLEAALEKGIESARTRGSLQWRIARIAELELRDYALAEKYYSQFAAESQRHVLYYRAVKSIERVRALRSGAGA